MNRYNDSKCNVELGQLFGLLRHYLLNLPTPLYEKKGQSKNAEDFIFDHFVLHLLHYF